MGVVWVPAVPSVTSAGGQLSMKLTTSPACTSAPRGACERAGPGTKAAAEVWEPRRPAA